MPKLSLVAKNGWPSANRKKMGPLLDMIKYTTVVLRLQINNFFAEISLLKAVFDSRWPKTLSMTPVHLPQ